MYRSPGALYIKTLDCFHASAFHERASNHMFRTNISMSITGGFAEGEAFGWSVLPMERYMQVFCSSCALQLRKDCVKVAPRRSENMAVIGMCHHTWHTCQWLQYLELQLVSQGVAGRGVT